MGAAGIEPANDGLEPSSLPLAYAPNIHPRNTSFFNLSMTEKNINI